MQVTYKPEDSTESQWRTWDFDPMKVRASRAEMIEKRADTNYSTWVKDIQSGTARARRVLLWHLMNLELPQLKMDDVPDFCMGELEVDYSVSDLQTLRREIEESSMDDVSKQEVLNRLDLEIATKLGKEDSDELTPGDLGKERQSENVESSS